ncbi:MAG TPA: histidine phosphatase family protein [Acidimicrobiales bacterium]|nr:histidine phosphatase family protein [Acidimicrobiales bacterium]
MLVLVRHGRTRWNAEGRFQGWADVPLDPEGRAQSERAAAELARDLAPERGATVRLVSSDLRRARETAAAIAAALGVTATAERDLREVDVGAWEGLTLDEVRERFPDEYRGWAADRDVRRGGGETLAEAGLRVAGCIERLAALSPGPLVVVGHGMSLQSGLDQLAGRGRVRLPHGAPHLGNAERLVLTDWRHDQTERLLSER